MTACQHDLRTRTAQSMRSVQMDRSHWLAALGELPCLISAAGASRSNGFGFHLRTQRKASNGSNPPGKTVWWCVPRRKCRSAPSDRPMKATAAKVPSIMPIALQIGMGRHWLALARTPRLAVWCDVAVNVKVTALEAVSRMVAFVIDYDRVLICRTRRHIRPTHYQAVVATVCTAPTTAVKLCKWTPQTIA